MSRGTAVIVGVGPGLGLELARIFGNAGHPVAMLARDKAKLDSFAKKSASLSVGKAGLRAYVQMLHDELAGTGVHATSVTITATIGSAPRFEPTEIAKAYLELENQAETEWQHELAY